MLDLPPESGSASGETGSPERPTLENSKHAGRDNMTNWRILLVSVLVVGSCLPGYADRASSAYKRGVKAEVQNDYDRAFEAFKEAHEAKPKDSKYAQAYIRLRFYAANEHVRAGQFQRDGGKLTEALAEFERAVAIDGSSFMAQQEVRRTTDMLRKQAQHEEVRATPQSPLAKSAEEVDGPMELRALPSAPTNLRMTEAADKIYKVLGKLAGLNVLFDPDYKPQRVSVELNDVTPREALNMLALQTKTFWQAVSPNTIFVAADTLGRRKEVQTNVMKTFYLKNVSTPTELQEAANTVKGMLDVSRVQLVPTQSAVILRGTQAQMILAEKLFSDIDKPKGEVIIDIAVMQVSRDRLRTLGTNVPTTANVTLVPGTGGSGGSGDFTVNSLGKLVADNFHVSFGGASVTFLMSDSNSKLIQNPEIRVLDNEKATLKIGDRVPISTGSFQSGLSGGVNTQFQYLDVGVNIDITPHIHSGGEVTLKMGLEISSVTGTQNIGGISQPVIGQRRIEHETRLKDGEVNLIGGILEDSETGSLSGYPWIAKIPILKYLFGQDTKDRRENEIVFSITPHIIRSQELNDQNLRLVDVGTGNAVEVRRRNPTATEANNAPPTAGSPALPHPNSTPSPQSVSAEVKDPKTASRTISPAAMASVPQNGRWGPSPPPANAPPAHASSDPCPYGQHFVQQQDATVVCAFD
jgi:general secretion pathway protein D